MNRDRIRAGILALIYALFFVLAIRVAILSALFALSLIAFIRSVVLGPSLTFSRLSGTRSGASCVRPLFAFSQQDLGLSLSIGHPALTAHLRLHRCR